MLDQQSKEGVATGSRDSIGNATQEINFLIVNGHLSSSPKGIPGSLLFNIEFGVFQRENRRNTRSMVGAPGLDVYDACMSPNGLRFCLRLCLLSCFAVLGAGTLTGSQERPGAALSLQANSLKPRAANAGAATINAATAEKKSFFTSSPVSPITNQ